MSWQTAPTAGWGEMSGRERRRKRRAGRRSRKRSGLGSALSTGAVLLVIGTVFLLDRAELTLDGVHLDIASLWPVILILCGAGQLLSYFARGLRDPGPVIGGVITALIGWFFLALTLGPLDYSQMAVLWPVFPLIAGIGCFAGWLASFGRRLDLLGSAFCSGAVGVIGLAFFFTPVGDILGAIGWPVFLIVGGVVAILGGILRASLRVGGGVLRTIF